MAELLKVIGREFGRLDMGRVKLDDYVAAWNSPAAPFICVRFRVQLSIVGVMAVPGKSGDLN
jgi:hypothetical protein